MHTTFAFLFQKNEAYRRPDIPYFRLQYVSNRTIIITIIIIPNRITDLLASQISLWVVAKITGSMIRPVDNANLTHPPVCISTRPNPCGPIWASLITPDTVDQKPNSIMTDFVRCPRLIVIQDYTHTFTESPLPPLAHIIQINGYIYINVDIHKHIYIIHEHKSFSSAFGSFSECSYLPVALCVVYKCTHLFRFQIGCHRMVQLSFIFLFYFLTGDQLFLPFLTCNKARKPVFLP